MILLMLQFNIHGSPWFLLFSIIFLSQQSVDTFVLKNEIEVGRKKEIEWYKKNTFRFTTMASP